MRTAALMAVSTILCAAAAAAAESLQVTMYTTAASGERLGTVTITESEYGLVFTPDLAGLPPGLHGFHIHEHAECGPGPDASGKMIPGGAAGSHYDPAKTGRHGSPWDSGGHLGDLPPLYADPAGKAAVPVCAPRLKTLSDIRGRSLMIHQGGDNFSDQPEANGGGGGRIACGAIR